MLEKSFMNDDIVAQVKFCGQSYGFFVKCTRKVKINCKKYKIQNTKYKIQNTKYDDLENKNMVAKDTACTSENKRGALPQ